MYDYYIKNKIFPFFLRRYFQFTFKFSNFIEIYAKHIQWFLFYNDCRLCYQTLDFTLNPVDKFYIPLYDCDLSWEAFCLYSYSAFYYSVLSFYCISVFIIIKVVTTLSLYLSPEFLNQLFNIHILNRTVHHQITSDQVSFLWPTSAHKSTRGTKNGKDRIHSRVHNHFAFRHRMYSIIQFS